MEYNKIVAVSGLPGLFELINSKTDGAIVKSLEDKSTRFVSSRVHNFSHLESIEIFTSHENVNLVEVLKAMEEAKDKLPDEKDAQALKSYFKKVYPTLDFERVYNSDLKKMVKWFSVLKNNQVEIKLTEPEEIAEPPAGEPAVPEAAKTVKQAEAPAAKKTAAKKKAEEVKEVKEVKEEKAEKSAAKKAKPASKKKEEKPAKSTAKKKSTKK